MSWRLSFDALWLHTDWTTSKLMFRSRSFSSHSFQSAFIYKQSLAKFPRYSTYLHFCLFQETTIIRQRRNCRSFQAPTTFGHCSYGIGRRISEPIPTKVESARSSFKIHASARSFGTNHASINATHHSKFPTG